MGVFQYSRNTQWYNTGTYYVESMCFQSDRFHFRYLLTWCGSKLYSNAALLDLVYQTLEKLLMYLCIFFNRTLNVLIIKNLKTVCPLHTLCPESSENIPILFQGQTYTTVNVSYVMEFLAWWVLKSKVFAQKSTVVKWNCCILWTDIAWGLQNWA